MEAGHRPVGVGHSLGAVGRSLGAVGRSLAGADIHTAAGSKLGHTIEQTDIRTSWLKMSIHTYMYHVASTVFQQYMHMATVTSLLIPRAIRAYHFPHTEEPHDQENVDG